MSWLGPGRFTFVTMVVAALATPSAQAPAGEPAYVVRGHQTEAHQREFGERLDRFHTRLAEVLRRDAPDLLTRLDPPPQPVVTGYQLLPRIVPDPPTAPLVKPQVVSYSWGWSDTLYANETKSLEKLERDLAEATAPGALFESLVDGYHKVSNGRRLIDADVDYNWLWQRVIATNRTLFDHTTRLMDEAVVLQAKSAPLTDEILAGPGIVSVPSFLEVARTSAHRLDVTVPFYTDITDETFLAAFRQAVEKHWHLQSGEDEFVVRLDIERIAPERLYCGSTTAGTTPEQSASANIKPCAPPANGAAITMADHVRRFPPGRGVLTTGGGTVHFTGGRVIVLSPHDVLPRTLAHEVGHLLGFPDAYLRGYRDLGAEGFRVMELLLDPADIMSSSRGGVVMRRHFDVLAASHRGQ